MKTITSFFLKGKTILVLFLLTNTIYLYMVLHTIPTLTQYTGDKGIPDMKPTGYDLTYLQDIFSLLGEAGSDYYLNVQLQIDLFYPIFFAITYGLMIHYLAKKLSFSKYILGSLAFWPVLAGAFDLMENFMLNGFLGKSIELTSLNANICSFFSQAKSLCTTLSFCILLVLTCWLAYRSIKRAYSQKTIDVKS